MRYQIKRIIDRQYRRYSEIGIVFAVIKRPVPKVIYSLPLSGVVGIRKLQQLLLRLNVNVELPLLEGIKLLNIRVIIFNVALKRIGDRRAVCARNAQAREHGARRNTGRERKRLRLLLGHLGSDAPASAALYEGKDQRRRKGNDDKSDGVETQRIGRVDYRVAQIEFALGVAEGEHNDIGILHFEVQSLRPADGDPL